MSSPCALTNNRPLLVLFSEVPVYCIGLVHSSGKRTKCHFTLCNYIRERVESELRGASTRELWPLQSRLGSQCSVSTRKKQECSQPETEAPTGDRGGNSALQGF
ncbi:hypothetical protein KIL84_022480 [Mauremys mutica]|uniref:Uncharacterized protein n=1 Tax=Mauremys mutica TaxID=74926 RepID=A0A9D3WQ75_9SAUR|nr:hypothetical protein KIL84_022480 [Mauremys mutica]